MANILAAVHLAHKSGLPEDAVVNTFSFLTTAPDVETADIDLLHTSLTAFYNVIPSGHNAIAGMIGPQISRVNFACVTKFYDLAGHLDGTPHGSPVAVRDWTLGPMIPGAKGLPSECACALSFRADYADDPEFSSTTRPRARDRGRIYIGPITVSSTEEEALTSRVKVTQSARETLVTQGAALRDVAGFAWAVWSRRNAILEPVVAVWADDAIDIQRRRGERAVARTAG